MASTKTAAQKSISEHLTEWGCKSFLHPTHTHPNTQSFLLLLLILLLNHTYHLLTQS